MDNTASVQTTAIPRKAGRPVGAKKRLGMSIEDRLKALEKIARSTNPDIKDDTRISAIKQITDILADRVDKNERMLPVYRLEFVLDRRVSNNSEQSVDNKPTEASNLTANAILSPEPMPVIPLPDYNDPTQDDMGQEIRENEGEEAGEKDSDSLF
jgi:hypothetical protein